MKKMGVETRTARAEAHEARNAEAAAAAAARKAERMATHQAANENRKVAKAA